MVFNLPVSRQIFLLLVLFPAMSSETNFSLTTEADHALVLLQFLFSIFCGVRINKFYSGKVDLFRLTVASHMRFGDIHGQRQAG